MTRNEEVSAAEESLIYDPSKVSWSVANLAKQPPHWTSKIFVYFLLATLAIGITYCYFAVVPVSIKTQGIIVAEQKSFPILANLIAQVVSVSVKDNMQVKKGDVLLVTDKVLDDKIAQKLKADTEFLKKQIEKEDKGRCDKKCYNAALRDFPRLFNAEAASPLKESLIQMRDLVAEYLASKGNTLNAQGLLAEQYQQIKIAQTKLKTIGAKKAEDLLKTDIERLNREIGSARAVIAERQDRVRTSFIQVKDRLSIRLDNFPQDVNSFQKANRYFSPADGTVSQLQLSGPGEILSPGKPIMMIIPEGSELIAEVSVPNKEIARVTKGQKVKIELQALPERDFGELNGTVSSIPLDVSQSPANTPSGGEPTYTVRVSLGKQAFTKSEKIYPIRLGMTVQAQIVVQEETLLILGTKKILKIKDSFFQ